MQFERLDLFCGAGLSSRSLSHGRGGKSDKGGRLKFIKRPQKRDLLFLGEESSDHQFARKLLLPVRNQSARTNSHSQGTGTSDEGGGQAPGPQASTGAG